MFENGVFSKLVADGRPTGEVMAVNRMLTRVKGLEGASVNSLVLFESGDKGLVRSIDDQTVTLLNLSAREVPLGTLAVLEDEVYKTPVGPEFIGRVVNVLGHPMDGKGPISASAQGAVFQQAPGIIERKALDTQLVTGVAAVDALFTFVLGQRIAVLGDSKSGKSTFLRQISQSQAGTDRIAVHVLISKRQVDIDSLVAHLQSTDMMKSSIVVVSSSFDSLTLSYLAPYVACAIGEYFWKSGKNTIMIYDDLTNHAKVYRELSLLAQTNPGRDSYPGDMFYAHSSLLERAGKLADGGGTQSAIPIVLTPNDDITAYLPTSIMSITDGQIIFDLVSFRKGIRPAVNVGLSVSRVGGIVQNAAWKDISGKLFRKLADYRQAAEFAQFGSELSDQSQADLLLGKLIYEVFKQASQEVHSLNTQYLMLATVMASEGRISLNVSELKEQAKLLAPNTDTSTDLQPVIRELLSKTTVQQAAKQ